MPENFDEIMDETQDELLENETMEQDPVFEDGDKEITSEEAEAVGRGEYSPEARANAWNEYNRLSDKDRETFLRGRSRNAHIMNMELRNERAGSATGEGEAAETTEDPESVGYSSDYYEHQMASALKNGNKIAYDNARSNWAKAKVRESVGSAIGEGEEEKHDSAYYEQKLREAIQKANMNGHPHVQKRDWTEAKEATGSTTGSGEAAETADEQESVGYSSDYYEHQMASALKNGNKIAYNNARSNWANAKVKESVGTTAGAGEVEEASEEKEAVGYYDSGLVQQAWDEYRRLPASEREKFLRSNSRTAHVMMVELAHMKRGDPVPGSKAETAESNEASETVGYSSDYYEHQMASALKNGNKIAYDNARSNWANAKAKESVGSTTG